MRKHRPLLTMQLEGFITDFQDKWGFWGIAAAVILAALGGYIIHRIVFGILKRWSRRSEVPFVHLLENHLDAPLKYVMVLLALIFTLSLVEDFPFKTSITHVLTIGLIAAATYLAIQVIAVVREIIISRYDVAAVDNLQARKIYTQFKIIERILVFVIVLFAIAVALMTFEQVRQVGVSLLASAGVIGVIVGFAAQKTLGNLLAGIQIAIAQPIRIDDVVIVEGEFGRVEEINLTYAIIKIWDERRLVVPINYFIEKPFQNWTRVSTDLLGAVFLYLNYNAPLEAMRQELQQVLEENPLWNRKAINLQVTDVKEHIIEVRILVSASNSSNTFNLRCQIREHMVTFLQKNYPECLPRTRMEVVSMPAMNGYAQVDGKEKMDAKHR